jgi:hypothetical protein
MQELRKAADWGGNWTLHPTIGKVPERNQLKFEHQKKNDVLIEVQEIYEATCAVALDAKEIVRTGGR